MHQHKKVAMRLPIENVQLEIWTVSGGSISPAAGEWGVHGLERDSSGVILSRFSTRDQETTETGTHNAVDQAGGPTPNTKMKAPLYRLRTAYVRSAEKTGGRGHLWQ